MSHCLLLVDFRTFYTKFQAAACELFWLAGFPGAVPIAILHESGTIPFHGSYSIVFLVFFLSWL